MTTQVLRNFCAAWACLSLAACSVAGEKDVEPTASLVKTDGSDVQAALRGLRDAQVVGSEGEVPYFIRGKLGRVDVGVSEQRMRDDALLRESLRGIGPVFRLRGEDLVLKRVSVDEQGHQHLRFQQMKNGLEVVGGELILHVDTEGLIYAVNGSARGGGEEAAVPTISAEAAVTAAVAGTDEADVKAEGAARRVYLLGEGALEPKLAYEVLVTGEGLDMPVRDKVYVDARTGAKLAVHPLIHSAKYRKIYSANNGTSLPGTLRRSEGQAATGDSHVDVNYDVLGRYYDCYKVNFNRDSYDNAGAVLKSTVHYYVNYVNAYWNGTQMVYGDGDGVNSIALGKDLDVTVHELTHAITGIESNLTYSNESGALNEALSDIFAAFCESWESGTWSTSNEVFMVGEDVWTPGTSGDALRYMYDPAKDGSSKDYYPERYTGTTDNGGVHWNSGIANLAFTLLSKGGTHPRGKTSIYVNAIGPEKAGRIFYKANTVLFTSSTTFAQAKTYTVQAAQMLGYDAATVQAVTNAWLAVGVPPPPPVTTPLTNGVPVTGLSGSTGSQQFFTLSVPSGQSLLTFNLSGGTGDADLYVRFGEAPTDSIYDCRPYLSGNTEKCSFTTSAAGTWYVRIKAYSTYSSVSLTGTSVPCAGSWSATGSMAASRANHTATLLPNGTVLVAGGSDAPAEVYDSATGTWSATGSMVTPRLEHTATLLPNGTVLVAGGRTGSSSTSSTEIYDPASGTWSATGSLVAGRDHHTATLLPNGKVLVVGGQAGGGSILSSAEVYDPATGTWSATGSLALTRVEHTATLLPNGEVLVVGGWGEYGDAYFDEVYDPATGTWIFPGEWSRQRIRHTATLLPNGKLLIAGGIMEFGYSPTELYFLYWFSSDTGSMVAPRDSHTATLLPNGKVLVAGGWPGGGGVPASSAEVYDPVMGTWMVTCSSMATGRYQHTATLLPNGKVLVTGGDGRSAELY